MDNQFKENSRKRIVGAVVPAALAVIVATAYLIVAVVDSARAESSWEPYAIIMFVLAVWNMTSYYRRNHPHG